MMCHLFYTSLFWVNSYICVLRVQRSCDNFSWFTRGGGGSWEGWDDAVSRRPRTIELAPRYIRGMFRSRGLGCVARAYLLHLVGCTIFVNKSVTFVFVSYLLLFNNLHMCHGYAWGATTLTHLYEQLGHACYFNMK